jgi:hypothetical protein
MKRFVYLVASVGAISAVSSVASADVVWNNGPVLTGTSTTGVTTGDPISAPQVYPGLSTATAGTSIKLFRDAEDFVLTRETTNLDSFTFYGWQSQSGVNIGVKNNPTVTAVTVNLWNTTPVTGGSPMYTAVTVPVTSSFVGWRESTVPGSTAGTRPIFAYTASLDTLGGDANLGAGTYWIEWVVTSTSSSNVFTPLVTPREQAYNLNLRLFGTLSGSQQWFETWESGVPTFPSPEAAPFILNGTATPEPATLASLAIAGTALVTRRRRA